MLVWWNCQQHTILKIKKNNDSLNKKIVDLFLLNISNEIEQNSFKIYGPKIVEINKSDEHSLKTSDEKIKILVELWKSLMDKNRYNDKLEFIRQGFATYLPQHPTYEELIDVSTNVLEFYNKSFESYVQNSIDIFLKQKDYLIDAYDEETRKMFELTDTQTKKVSELILAVSGTFLLSFLNKNALLTNLPLVAVAIFFNLIYGLLNLEFVYQSEDQKDSIQGRMALTSQRVNNILPNAEDVTENIDEYSKFFNEAIKKFDKTRRKGLIRITFFCSFLIGILAVIVYFLITKKWTNNIIWDSSYTAVFYFYHIVPTCCSCATYLLYFWNNHRLWGGIKGKVIRYGSEGWIIRLWINNENKIQYVWYLIIEGGACRW